ncbi:MAG: 3-deoxy-D-manno-octulosonic acid transferase, partial [Armatimonadetes bacterium]|nr:3-deoxy-D-manno-octulosonic acid transferase [Armatimonadota bacterium]
DVYKRQGWVYRWALANIDLFCMQSEADAERIVLLGADPARVKVTGNCKADEAPVPLCDEEKRELRALLKIPAESPVFVAGSTNPGEDAPVLEAFVGARKAHPDLRLVVAPRQIDRASEIEALVRNLGLSCVRRSQSGSFDGGTDVVILDTFGELARMYAIADVTFVGGSLIPKGCHSILQPIAQGKPVFFGPYTFKARDLVGQAKQAGVGFEVKDGTQLGIEVARFLSNRGLLEEIRLRCERMMAGNRGASRRTAEALAELIRPVLS